MLKLPEERRRWGGSRGAGRVFFSPLPLPLPLSFFRPRTYRKGYYFYSPQSSTVIKSKMADTTILRTRTRFRPPKIRLHLQAKFSGSHTFSLTATAKIGLYFRFALPAGMLFWKRNENRAWSQVVHGINHHPADKHSIYSIKRPTSDKRPPYRLEKLISDQARKSALFEGPKIKQAPRA